MSAKPNKPAIAWRTISTGLQTTSTVLDDINKTKLLSDVTTYSESIEVADISVLGMPTDTQPGTVWIEDERIDYWSVSAAPTTLLPNRGFLQQLWRGTYNTPTGNVSTMYDTIFYDGNGVTTYFATPSGTLPPGGNFVVYLGTSMQVDNEIDSTRGSYSVVENPVGQLPGQYIEFDNAPPVGWRNVRISSPRYEVSYNSQISHIAGATVIAAGIDQTIPGGYQWIPTPNGLQYSPSSMATFLLNHQGTRS